MPFGDPEFAHIVARQDERQARERKVILNIVCTDNLYEAVWQPDEGAGPSRAAAALASQNARTAWALVTQGTEYQRRQPLKVAFQR